MRTKFTNEWVHWVRVYEKSMKEYYLSDKEKREYQSYLGSASEAKGETDRDTLKAEMELLRQTVQEENEACLAELDGNKAKIEKKYDLKYALPTEMEAIKQSKAKYEKLIQNKKYPDAIAETENCMKLEAGDYSVMEQAGYLKPDGGIVKEMNAYIKKNEEAARELCDSTKQ